MQRYTMRCLYQRHVEPEAALLRDHSEMFPSDEVLPTLVLPHSGKKKDPCTVVSLEKFCNLKRRRGSSTFISKADTTAISLVRRYIGSCCVWQDYERNGDDVVCANVGPGLGIGYRNECL